MSKSAWQKSSYSGASNECVEVRNMDILVELRESDSGEIVIRTTPRKFAKFLQDIKNGEFDHHAEHTA
ncbi:DUF397 domain-containing protein [Kitasatospora sp. NPDC056184]|uniref:DUF397 domain-containing protein n=1 Tax=Kitasatospora sp. NPDC056184 TaxID=3345738 RepID=UPI0035DEF4D0